MKAMILRQIVSLDATNAPLELVELPIPAPELQEILIRVTTCGVCHTELDEIEGRTAPPRLPVVPGHEVVGLVEQLGEHTSRFSIGDRVGVGWIYSSTGAPDENLSPSFKATGRDVNGGYAQYMVVPERYAFPVPANFLDAQAAPLLCAGAIGYRALKLSNLVDGQRLGLTGFGASAHLVLQVARHLYPSTSIHVFARHPTQREFATQLGADWVGDTHDRPPQPLDTIIDTTPAWKPVVAALANLRPGGRLVINAIRKQDTDQAALLDLRYHDHLWMEKEIKTVANITHDDIAEFLPIAASVPLHVDVTLYRLEDANRALMDLRHGRMRGACVLQVNEG